LRINASPTWETVITSTRFWAAIIPDPSVLRVGDDYYMVHSSFNYAPGLLIWHSTDLVNWQPLAYALPQYDGDVWAPELIRHDGTFYIYYKTSGGNHVVTSTRIEGPWSEPGNLMLGYIDPRSFSHARWPAFSVFVGWAYDRIGAGWLVNAGRVATRV
jgi:beta-xylosidase